MKLSFKNIALASTILLVPMKSTNTVREAEPVAKKVVTSKFFNDSSKFEDKELHDILYAPIIRYKKLEAERALNYIRMPKPSKDLNVAETKFVGHPKFLNMFLTGVLKGKGEKFIEAQEKHGVNATFLVGIANLESGNGFSDYARKRNNIAGMRTSKGYMYFSSVDECIDRMAENLKRNYIDDGLVTIKQIHKRYAENPKWADIVVDRMNPMYQASQCKVYDFTRK